MSFEECVKFANEVGTCFLATAEGDQPRVRPLQLCFADNTGFYFQTEAVKSLAKQLKSNPKVELVFWQPQGGGGLGVHMRVSGEVRFVNDPSIRERIFKQRAELLKGVGIESAEDPEMVVFQVFKGQAFFWTLENNTKESEIQRITF